MKLNPLVVALWILPVTPALAAGQAANQTAAPKPSQTPNQANAVPAPQTARPADVPKSSEEWLIRMTDFSHNGSAFRDPRLLVPWANAMTEPNTAFAAAQGMMDPAGWLNMTNSMVSPDAYRNMAVFADPAVQMRLLGMAMNPALYAQLGTTMMDPGKMMRWVMVPFDPRIQTLGGQFMNPNFYMKWGSGAMDPRAWNLAGNLMHPGTYTGMMGVAMDPRSYGPTWGTVFAPMVPAGTADANNAANKWLTHVPAPSMSNSNPWGTTTTGAYGFNFFDPQAMMAMVGGAVPGMSNPASGNGGGLFGPAGVYVPGQPPLAGIALVAKPAEKPAQPAPAGKVAEKAPEKTAEKATEKATEKPPVAAPAPVAAAPQPVAVPASANRFVLSADTLFRPGKSDIKSLTKEGKKLLDETVAKIKALGTAEQIVVIGHADPTGKAKANRALSVNRAKAVKSYLVAKGIKPGIVVSSGVGDTQPVVQCDSKLPKAEKIKCNAPNRRIEVEVRTKAPK